LEAELRDKLTQALLDALADTQRRSGRDAQEIDEDTIPFLDLACFDSHNGVEVEVLLSEQLGVEIEEIPFHEGRHGSRELRVGEIVNVLIQKNGTAIRAALKREREELVTH
jgi:hypothetical protein